MNKLSKIQKTLLMGPGPSCVSDSVYKALAKPTLGHLDTEFIEIMDSKVRPLVSMLSILAKFSCYEPYYFFLVRNTRNAL